MKCKILGVAVLLLLHIATSFAQTRNSDSHITGHVIDQSSGDHIPYVTISIKGTTMGITTDATGHFLLKNVPVGEHTLVATFLGYERVEQTVTVPPLKTIEIEIVLIPQALELSGVVITGSRNETNRRESSTIVNVLSSKTIESIASVSVGDVLNFQPGLRVEMSCLNCGAPELRINGLSGQYSQILLDSRPIFSSLAGVYGLEQLPAGMIERVEVIRGGGSALFGSSAIGGVVNIITKEPLRNSFEVSNNTGFFGRGLKDVNTSLNGSFVTDDYRAGIYLFGVANNRDTYDRNGDGFSEIPVRRSETLGFRGYYKLTDYSKLTAEFHRIHEFRRGGDHPDRPPHEADIAEQTEHSINGGGLKYDFFSKNYKHRLNLYASAQGIDRQSYYGTGKDPNAYGKTSDFTIVAGSQYTYSVDQFLLLPADITAGVEYTGNTLDDRMPVYDRYINQHAQCVGGFFQSEWKNEFFSLLVGGRVDKHNLMDKIVFVPRANVRYVPVREVTLRAGYSSGYRAPQAFDEDLHVAAVGGEVALIELDPNLRPEYSHSFNFSVDLYKKFRTVEANLLIDAFYTDIRDVFALEEIIKPGDNNKHLMRTNEAGAVVQGVNMDLKLGITSKFIVDAGFTIQSSRYKEPYKWSENVPAGKQMLRAPGQYGYARLNYTPVKQFTASVTGNYTGSMLVPHFAGFVAHDEERWTPAFFDAGLRLAYDFSLSNQLQLQLSGGMKNIFDQYQKDPDVGNLRDAGYIYGPSMPRIVYFGVKLMM